ncbi:hypothetical protein PROPEN_00027 [Proteus penneri ATCC 35198]|nr:hypothetical protein PROPEN_00027 [Proteus penneri ATCC 35198]
MHDEPRLSRHTKNLIEWYLKACERIHGTHGLPRGLEISPMLSELYLSEFDLNINRHTEVFYYSRFVDDMVIVSSGNESQNSFMKQVEAFLPNGLKLNKDKLNISPLIPKRSKGNNNGKLLHQFDFLGYSFSIIDTQVPKNAENSIYRNVVIDLSSSRLKK